MATLKVKIPEASKSTFAKLLKEMGGEILSESSQKAKREKALLNQIEAGLNDVDAIRSGKIKRVSLAEALRD